MTEVRRASQAGVDKAMRGLFSRDALYSVIWSVQAVSTAVVTPILTRILGVAEFGQLATSIAIVQVLFVLVGFGLQTALQRSYAGVGGAAEARRLVTFGTFVAILATAAAYVTGRWWTQYLGFTNYTGVLRLAVLSAGLMAVITLVQALLRSEERLLAFGCLSGVLAIGGAGTGLILAVALERSAQMYMLGHVLAQIVAAVLALALARPRAFRMRDVRVAQRALAFGLPLVPVGLNAFVLSASDRLIVQDQLGLVAVARYQIAYNVGELPMLLVYLVSWSWLPRLLALNEASDRPTVLAASRDALYTLLAPVILGLSVVAPVVLRIWSPQAYQVDELLLTTCIVVITVVPYTASIMVENALTTSGRTVLVAVATTVAAGANVVLNFFLVPKIGLAGAGLATLASYILLFGMLLARARVVARVRRSRVSCRLLLVGACALSFTTVALPTTTGFLVLRSLVALALLAWFVWLVTRLIGPRSHAIT